jgi:hypothetical protein
MKPRIRSPAEHQARGNRQRWPWPLWGVSLPSLYNARKLPYGTLRVQPCETCLRRLSDRISQHFAPMAQTGAAGLGESISKRPQAIVSRRRSVNPYDVSYGDTFTGTTSPFTTCSLKFDYVAQGDFGCKTKLCLDETEGKIQSSHLEAASSHAVRVRYGCTISDHLSHFWEYRDGGERGPLRVCKTDGYKAMLSAFDTYHCQKLVGRSQSPFF